MKKTTLCLAGLMLWCGPALANDIQGRWKVENGETVAFSPCGSAYCAVVESGRYAGKSIGRMEGPGPKYTGTITDPKNSRTYDGTAELDGNRLTLSGCVAKIFCRSQIWTR